MLNELFYLIALTLTPGIGPSKARTLLRNCGSAEAVFQSKNKSLLHIPDIGPATIKSLRQIDGTRIERIIDYIERKGIRTASFLQTTYPDRLRHCDDAPILLYGLGNFEWNPRRTISIVGTRKATEYGKSFCHTLLQTLEPYKPVIVSGLAYGIDACAHQAAIDVGLPTIGCVAHGLDRIYPDTHRQLAARMVTNGGLITEFAPFTTMAPELFPMRNRLIAGLSDCTIVLETDLKGGSMITAHIANSYGREVFALCGRHNDRWSRGCIDLIKKNLAAILTKPEDIIEYMGWNEVGEKHVQQLRLFENLSDEERCVVDIIAQADKPSFDDILTASSMSWGQLNSILISLEFESVVRSLPGKRYEISG